MSTPDAPPSPRAEITVSGTVLASSGGLIVTPATFGPVSLHEHDDGTIGFEVKAAVPVVDDLQPLLQRVALAVEAAIAAAFKVGVQVQNRTWTYARPGQPELRNPSAVRGQVMSVSLTATPFEETEERGRSTAEAVLCGSDERLAELYEVYLLGLRGVSTVAPVVGFWAFSVILEEPNPGSLLHVTNLATELRDEGYRISKDPQRNPPRIRNAVLHPSPKDPLPTRFEVEWFRQVAEAYLLRRAGLFRIGY